MSKQNTIEVLNDLMISNLGMSMASALNDEGGCYVRSQSDDGGNKWLSPQVVAEMMIEAINSGLDDQSEQVDASDFPEEEETEEDEE